ncbi:glycerate kinase family protein [Rubrivivax rivuli]|uniref:Glycerate kinase n=1 Tax=Rubrivivax rivuli TaxID=1862385 RepID=A0A437RF03_9BURK|nr:glycerate kinase [Rubrivivax rivuli]RVU45294.1 glycerate kinase [Rubrivivax rivuli]
MKTPAPHAAALTVLIAPSGFKESLSAEEAADRIAEGVTDTMPGARVIKLPMADGGEGFTQALVNATGGRVCPVAVTGPVGQPVQAFFGLLGGRSPRTAVVEMAAAAGLRLVPRDQRNPMRTTSYGVGQLIRAALDAGAQRVLLGCGDSGINDGGAGMVQALGAKLLDAQGQELGAGGGELLRLHRIDLSGLDPRLARVQLDAAVNWHNVLLGPRGVARVFGPQKGATPEQVVLLEQALENWAACLQRTTGSAWGTQPGSGASGGLGSGFAALLGGQLHPRFDIVMQYLELDRLIAQADLVITAEGSLDDQTPFGKVPAEVASRAKKRGLPVIALTGTLGHGAEINLKHGIDAFASMLSRPCTLDQAIADAGKLLRRSAADMLRMVSVGMKLGRAPRRLALAR